LVEKVALLICEVDEVDDGANFRFDNGSTRNYQGPFYDVYELSDVALQGGRMVYRAKVYCINSKTKLLERVQYSILRGNKTVRVETVLSDWQSLAGERFPTSVTRFEDGQQVWKADINPMAVGQAEADGRFSHP
jgi:hypothetical protein